jgi:hypothetical protein
MPWEHKNLCIGWDGDLCVDVLIAGHWTDAELTFAGAHRQIFADSRPLFLLGMMEMVGGATILLASWKPNVSTVQLGE